MWTKESFGNLYGASKWQTEGPRTWVGTSFSGSMKIENVGLLDQKKNQNYKLLAQILPFILMLCNDPSKGKYKSISLLWGITNITQSIFCSLYMQICFIVTRQCKRVHCGSTRILCSLGIITLYANRAPRNSSQCVYRGCLLCSHMPQGPIDSRLQNPSTKIKLLRILRWQ